MIEIFLPILKDLIGRLLPDPAQRLEAEKALATAAAQAREAEAQMEGARAKEFADFIAATQPSPDRVYVWANTLIALVRPALAVFTAVSLIVYTDRWLNILNVLKGAGIWGAVGISPLLVWVLGRDGLRMILGVVATARGTSIPAGVLPPGLPDEREPSGNGSPKPPSRPKPVWVPPALPRVPGDNRPEVR